MSKQKETEWATIGRIVAPFGLRGAVKVFSLSDVPDRFATLEKVYLTPDYECYTIKEVRPYKGDTLLLQFVGINNATKADALRNCEVCVPLEELARLPVDSYYQHDILGLQVLLLSGQEIGTIVDIIVTGSNDVYVVKLETGRQVLIPAIKEVIKQVDLIRRVMYIEPMRGMLEDEEEIEDLDEEEE